MSKEKEPEDRPVPEMPPQGAGFYDGKGDYGKKETPQDFLTSRGVKPPAPAHVQERQTDQLEGMGINPAAGDEKVLE